MWSTVLLTNAMFVNTKIRLANHDETFSVPLQGIIKYQIILSNISVLGGGYTNKFSDVHGVILRHATFERSGGIYIMNVTM